MNDALHELEIKNLKLKNYVLRTALENLVKINEIHNDAVGVVIGHPLNWKDDYLNEARMALKENENETY